MAKHRTDTVTISTLETPVGLVWLAATGQGLCKIAFERETEATFQGWLDRARLRIQPTPQAEAALRRAEAQLLDYLNGARRTFDLPLDLRGTAFQRAVWEAVAAIPYGQTSTYGAIAAGLGKPAAVRAVGAANGANPLPILVPCHRVIGADGGLTGYGGGLAIKRALLALEQTGRLESAAG